MQVVEWVIIQWPNHPMWVNPLNPRQLLAVENQKENYSLQLLAVKNSEKTCFYNPLAMVGVQSVTGVYGY